MDRILRNLHEIDLFLGRHSVPHMAVGGLANMVWGAARTTVDIDMAVAMSDEALPSIVSMLTDAGFSVLPPEPLEFARQTRVLPIRTAGGVKIDLILALLPYEVSAIQRAVQVDLGGIEAPVCTPEDLIVLKAVSTRTKDWEDIDGVITRVGRNLDRGYLVPILQELRAVLERPEIGGLIERIGRCSE